MNTHSKTCFGIVLALLFSPNLLLKAGDAVSSPPMSAPVVLSERGKESCAEQIEIKRIFPLSIVNCGTTALETDESCELLAVLNSKGREALMGEAETFLEKHPHSPYGPALRAGMATFYHKAGRTTAALHFWNKAWQDLRGVDSPQALTVKEYILVNGGRLLASLGRISELENLRDDWNNRPFSRPDWQKEWLQISQAIDVMKRNPAVSFRCGSYALGHIALQLGRQDGNLKEMTKTSGFLFHLNSPAGGFSMAELNRLAETNRLDFVAVRRPEGDQSIVIPSVVHWRQNHYAAILEKRGSGYLVADPTFGGSRVLSAKALNEEASGCFMVALNDLPQSWEKLKPEEAAAVRGKGFPNEPPPCPPCSEDEPDGPTECDGCDNNTGPGGMGPGGNGPGGNGPGGCCKPGAGGGAVRGDNGMATWQVMEPNILLKIKDVPMLYQTARGGIFSLKVNYQQNDARPYDTNVFGLGYNWNLNWLAFVDFDEDYGYPYWDQWAAKEFSQYAPGGGLRRYTVEGTNSDGGATWTLGGSKDRYGQVQFAPFGMNYGQVISDPQNVPTNPHAMTYPDGRKDYYGFFVTNSSGDLRAYRTRSVDRNGLETQYLYTNINHGSSFVTQLKYVLDKDGRTNTLAYSSTKPYLITAVTNPFNAVVLFGYDNSDHLTNITDVIGVPSRIDYDTLTNNLVLPVRLVTPYGTNQFEYGGVSLGIPGTYNSYPEYVNLFIRVTQPDGGKHLFLYRDYSTYLSVSSGTPFLGSYANEDQPLTQYNLPIGWCDQNNTADPILLANETYYYRNSFYWGPRQYAACNPTDIYNLTANQYLYARRRHYLHGADKDQNLLMLVSPTLAMEQLPSPNGTDRGARTWFGHEGKTLSYSEGLHTQPSLIVQETGESWYRITYLARNNTGRVTTNITTYTDTTTGQPAFRTNIYVYADNSIDLREAFGPDGKRDNGYGYDANANMLKSTNALGEVTSYTYNANGQLTSIKTPAGLTTTNIYFTTGPSIGFLDKTIDLEINRTNSYTYSNGQVSTHTDERGLTVTNTWDAIQRLTSTHFSDGTSSYTSNRYDIATRPLNLAASKDRLGNWTSFGYDAMGRRTAATNALQNYTLYSYCTCGSLDSIQDALNNSTLFYYDYQGKLANTLYPDGYKTTNTYNLIGQVINSTDSGGNIINRWYNNQGLLVTVSNSVGLLASHIYNIEDQLTNSVDANAVSVSMTYDDLHRLRTRTYPDTGVEKFGYTANVSGATSYTNQIANVTLYAYDLASRKTNEVGVGIFTNKFSYNAASDLLALKDGKNQTTTWGYDQYGRVTNKVDNLVNTLFIYKYDANSRLTNRWSNAKQNTYYTYDNVGNLTFVNYLVSPDITLSYDKLNRLTNMVDAVGTTTYGYDAAGQLLSEDGPWSDDTVSYTYEKRLRKTLGLAQPTASAWAQTYGHDVTRRLTGVTSLAGAFGYAYKVGQASSLSLRLSLPGSSYITNDYDSVARLLSTSLRNSGDTNLNAHVYAYNLAGQRTNQTRIIQGGTNNIWYQITNAVAYTYDTIGELKTATGKEADTTARQLERFGYAYDAAGNLNYRTNHTLVQTFTVNSLNELSNVVRSGRMTVEGTTTSKATNVTVNTTNALLYTDYTFASTNHALADGANTFTAIAKDSYGRLDTNIVTVNLPATSSYVYDLNGNLRTNGTRTFDYDDENQLITITESNAWKAEFTYDGKMRRRIETNYVWQGSVWVATNVVRYVYDGNLPIQHRDAANLPVLTLTRGNDLSGSLQGAGGIGGLLAMTENSADILHILPYPFNNTLSPANTLFHADGNGNVTALINASQLIVGRYLYDPFGNTLSISGSKAAVNRYRFSSKPVHELSGMYDYLYRWYDANLQRWLNRDPLGDERNSRQFSLFARMEQIGLVSMNLFGFAKNSPLIYFDTDGRFSDTSSGNSDSSLYDYTLCTLIEGLKAKQDAQETGENWTRYAHCLASCRIARNCGKGPAIVAGHMKEVWDLIRCFLTHSKDHCHSALQPEDEEDNKKGYECPPKKSCEDQCGDLKGAKEPPGGPFTIE